MVVSADAQVADADERTMFKRQKIILGLIVAAPKVLTRTELMKWLFLLRQESPLGSDHSFYDFIPYKHGPFSFVAYRDLDQLLRYGYLNKEALSIPEPMDTYVKDEVRSLTIQVRQAIREICVQYSSFTLNELLDYVYCRYPWFASRSERIKSPRPELRKAGIAIYTAGYEGESIDQFFKKLLRAGMQRVLDVRSNPVSRKYGYAKATMERICKKLDLEYIHLPELGIPQLHRRSLKTFEDYQQLLQQYEQQFLPNASIVLQRASSLIQERPSVLVCFEADVRCCHRSRLARSISSDTGLAVTHL